MNNTSIRAGFLSDRKFHVLLIFITAFVLYANTLKNEYALDDAIVITKNEFTKEGFAGIKKIFSNDSFTGFFGKQKKLVQGGRYRPLSIVSFAIEYQFFKDNPGISHLINILIYAFTGVLIYLLILSLINNTGFKEYRNLPALMTALIFIFHPVHTEVVANIKGRDELLAFLFSLLALKTIYSYFNSGKRALLLPGFLYFLLALLSKENAISFLFIIPLTLWFFGKNKNRTIIISTVPLVAATGIYFLIRYKVLGQLIFEPSHELMNNPFTGVGLSRKYATILFTLGMYLKLIFFPHPLTYDYYPYHIEIQNWTLVPIIILMVYFILTAWTLAGLKKRNVPAYGFIIFLISLFPASNLLINVGTFMNERFIYIPSLGIIISFVFFLFIMTSKLKKINIAWFSWMVVLPVLVIFFAVTFNRNKSWKNDYTLFTTDVKVSSNSAKSNCSAGGILIEKAGEIKDEETRQKMLSQAINYLNKAISIHPGYIDALLLMGNAQYEYYRNIDSVWHYYSEILDINPSYDHVYSNLEMMIGKVENADTRIRYYERLYHYNPNSFNINYNLGNLYGKYKNDIPKAIKFLLNAAGINDERYYVCKDLGVAYGISGDYKNSAYWLEKASKLKPDDALNLINLGITYRQAGNISKADSCFTLAFKLDPSLKR